MLTRDIIVESDQIWLSGMHCDGHCKFSGKIKFWCITWYISLRDAYMDALEKLDRVPLNFKRNVIYKMGIFLHITIDYIKNRIEDVVKYHTIL